MKKIYSLLAIAAVLSVSCAKEELQAPSADVKDGTYLTLEGTFAPSTRISVGEMADNVYPVTWTAGDALGLFSTTEGAAINNIMARLDASTAGQKAGKFVTGDPVKFPEGSGAELLIYYPYNELAVPDGSVLNTVIPVEQVATANSSENLGKYTLAYSAVNAENEADLVQFSMKHAAAYARVVISTTEYAGYNLKSVVLRDLTGEKALSDTVKVNLKTGELVLGSTPKSYVRTVLATPYTLGTDAVEVWVSAIPADFSTTPLYVAVEMEAADGSRTVTIPVKCNGNLKANAVNTLELLNLSSSSNELKWYEPVETRHLAGGWAYSDANCYMQKTNTSAVVEQEISVKARGNFAHVNEPKFASILMGEHNNNKTTTYLNGSNAIGNMITIPDTYTIKVGTKSGGTGQYGMGEVAFFAADQLTVLWTVGVWSLGSDIKTVTYKCGLQVMDRNLGSYNAMWNDWKNAGPYYQWGRPTPLCWSPSTKEGGVHAQSISEADALAGKYSLDFIFSRPDRKFSPAQNFANAKQNWYVGSGKGEASDLNQGFWGNPDPNSTDGGHKSIYDPCPKGYRVISPAIVKELETAQLELKENGFNSKGNSYLDYYVYTIDENNVDYIPTTAVYTLYNYHGNVAGMIRTATPSSKSGVNTKVIAALWTNAPVAADSPYSYAFAKAHTDFNHATYYETQDGKQVEKVRSAADVLANIGGRANGLQVRCMVDTENR